MGLFEKKFCELCSNKVNVLTRQKLSDGYLCSDCKHKLSSLSSGWKTRSIDDVKRHLEQRENNKQKYADFKQSVSVGSGENLVVDFHNKRFYFALGKDYKDGNPEIFRFEQIQEFWIEVGYTTMSDSDHDGIPDSRDHYDNRTGKGNGFGGLFDAINNATSYNQMNVIPPSLIPYVRDNRRNTSSPQRISSVSANFVVRHDFITEVKLSIDSYISENSNNDLSKAFNVAQKMVQTVEMMKSILKTMAQNYMATQPNTVPMQNDMNYQQNNAQVGAFCPNCGYHLNANEINSKFCPNCGSKR